MQNLNSCPNCGTPLRGGARYCVKCGTSLNAATAPLSSPDPRAVTRPLSNPDAPALAGARPTLPLQNAADPARDGARPAGAIIADRYLVTGLLFDNGSRFSYPVREFHVPPGEKALQCPNPTCGAIHWKAACPGEYPAAVCELCSTPLEMSHSPALVVHEVLDPAALGRAPEVARLGLVHGSLRAPLDSATEMVCGQPRALVVEPQVNPLPDWMDPAQVIRWLPGLAAALDTLHASGITFRGKVTSACFGFANERTVWAHFTNCSVMPVVPAAERAADARGLASCLFSWMTGRVVHSGGTFFPDPGLSGAQNAFFALALTGAGFASGADLARGLEKSQQERRADVPVEYHFGRRTDVGRLRSLNEDSILTIETARVTTGCPHPAGIFVVADGMGGHAAGEVASGAIVNFLQARCMEELGAAMLSGAAAPAMAVDWQSWLRTAVEQVNQHVFDMRKAAGTDMGSTIVIAMLDGPRAYLTHIGDSRIYLVNNREIRRLTVDHSLVERLVATGQIRPEEAYHHPHKNVVYRTVGDKPRVDLEISVLDLAIGDRLLLCSDGLSGMLMDDQIYKVVLSANSPQSACDALVTAANAAGGEDNISVIVVEVVRG